MELSCIISVQCLKRIRDKQQLHPEYLLRNVANMKCQWFIIQLRDISHSIENNAYELKIDGKLAKSAALKTDLENTDLGKATVNH